MISDKIVELRRTIEEYTCLHIPPVQCDIMGSECIPNIPTWRNVFLVRTILQKQCKHWAEKSVQEKTGDQNITGA
jgi:hypothetical protein